MFSLVKAMRGIYFASSSASRYRKRKIGERLSEKHQRKTHTHRETDYERSNKRPKPASIIIPTKNVQRTMTMTLIPEEKDTTPNAGFEQSSHPF
jgi:hypothetical protein